MTGHLPGGEAEHALNRKEKHHDIRFPGGGGMSQRVAIVVGAGGELGRATAEKLAAAGFTVVAVDRSEEALKELPDGIRREAADPTDPAAARTRRRRPAASRRTRPGALATGRARRTRRVRSGSAHAP